MCGWRGVIGRGRDEVGRGGMLRGEEDVGGVSMCVSVYVSECICMGRRGGGGLVG